MRKRKSRLGQGHRDLSNLIKGQSTVYIGYTGYYNILMVGNDADQVQEKKMGDAKVEMVEVLQALSLWQLQRQLDYRLEKDHRVNWKQEFDDVVMGQMMKHKDLFARVQEGSVEAGVIKKIIDKARNGFVVGDKVARRWDDRCGTITRITDAWYWIKDDKIKKEDAITYEEKLIEERHALQKRLKDIEERFKA